MRLLTQALPAGWRWEEIAKHIASTKSGIASGTKSRLSGFPHLRMNNIGVDFRLNLDQLWRIPASADEVAGLELKPGDILFNNTNSAELVGKSCLFDHDVSEVYLYSNHLTRIRVKDSLNPYLLLCWIEYLWRGLHFESNADQWVNQAAARVEDVLFPLSIPLPGSRAEQDDVASRLDRVIGYVRGMNRAATLQAEAVSRLLGALLASALPFRPGEALPPGWRWARLGDEGKVNPERPATLGRSDEDATTFVPMASVDGEAGRIGTTEVRPFGRVKRGYVYYKDGDVLFAKITPCMQNGKHFVAANSIGGFGFASTEFHVVRPGPKVTADWVHTYLRLPRVLRDAEASFVGAVGQQRVPDDFLKQLDIPVPSTDEQRAMVARLKRSGMRVAAMRAACGTQLPVFSDLRRTSLEDAFFLRASAQESAKAVLLGVN
jgi:hypothetical protein